MASSSSSSSSSSSAAWRSVREMDARWASREETIEAFAAVLASAPELASYNARDDARAAAKAVAAAFAFVTKALPPDVIIALSEFAFDPAAPVALVLRGLALPDDLPPTPRISTIHGILDDSGDASSAMHPRGSASRRKEVRVPMAEAWALGLGRVLGHPFVPPFFDAGHRGGLVRDMVPVPGIDNLCGLLEMHRDFPAAVFAPFPEPETFLLVCVRGDPTRRAKTIIVDSQVLLQALSDDVKSLLSRHEMQVEIVEPPEAGGKVHRQGAPFFAVDVSSSASSSSASSSSEDDDPARGVLYSSAVVTLFVPDAGAFAPGSIGRVVSPTGGAPAERAWRTMMDAALRLGDQVDLQQGDCLILNNVRCCHGRTAFEPTGDGSDRWLVKSYVTSNLWTRPGLVASSSSSGRAGGKTTTTTTESPSSSAKKHSNHHHHHGRVAYPTSVLSLDQAAADD